MKQNNRDFEARNQYDQGAIVGAAHATDGQAKCIPPSKIANFNWCAGYHDGYDKVNGGRLAVIENEKGVRT